jgi:hypothetical protein
MTLAGLEALNGVSAQVSEVLAALQQIDPLVQAAEAGFVAGQQQIDALLAKQASLQQQVLDLTNALEEAQGAEPVGFTELAPGGDLQGLIDKNVPVLVRGTWPQTTAKLQLPPTGPTSIWLGDDAVLNRNFTNRDKTKPSGDVSIRGKGRLQSQNSGDLFHIWCASLQLLDFITDLWHGGRWCMPGVDGHMEIGRVRFTCAPDASSGDGGLRTSHCGSGLVYDCNDCSAGDDLWQAVPAGGLDDFLFNKGDVNNLTFTRLHNGRSYNGRFGVEGLQDEFDNRKLNGMTSGVHNVTWDTLDGFSGKSAYVHQNKSSSGSITGTRTKNVTIYRQDATAGQAGEVYMYAGDWTGGVDDVQLDGITIPDHRVTPGEHDHPIYAQQGKVTNVTRPLQAA